MATNQLNLSFYAFQDLTPDEFAGIGSIFLERQYPRGAMLFHQGEVPHELFFIQRGSVEVFRIVENARVLITSILGGEALGEISFFGAMSRSASAVATSDVTAFVCRGEAFAKLLADNTPGIGKVLGRILESTVRRFKLLEAKSATSGSTGTVDSDTTAETRLMQAIARQEVVRMSISSGNKAPMEGLFHIVDISNSLGIPLLRLTLTREAGGREYIVPMSSVHHISFVDATGKF